VTAQPPVAGPNPRGTVRDTVSVLLSPNMLPYLAGNVLSGTGMWFQILGQSILIYRLTGSTFLLGVLSFSQFAAVFLLAPWAGSVADRFDRRYVLAASELSAVVITAALTVTAALGGATTWTLIAFALALGVRSAFSSPSAMALVPTLVEARYFSTALALNSVTFNVGRSIGPVLAAVVINSAGTTWSFGVAAAMGLPLAVSVLFVRPLTPHTRPDSRPQLRESIRLVLADKRLTGLLYVIAAVSLCTDPAVTLGPAFVSRALHHRDSLAGLLVGAFGAGGVLAAFTISHRLRGTRTGIATTLALAAAGTAAFSVSPTLGLALVALFATGYGYLTTNVGATSRLQLGVEASQRGRIMALWTICFLGIRPIGSLVDGAIASGAGVRVASFVMSLPAVAGVVAILLVRARGARQVAERASNSA
jgi:predicted MFS family arabinose efflux permease